jgi:hypothetical protein
VPDPNPSKRPTGQRRPEERSLIAWLLAMVQYKPTHGLATHWRLIFFAILGTVMGTLLDALNVATGTAGYRGVALVPYLGVAWYVPPEFGVAGMVVGMLRPELDEELSRPRSYLPGWKVFAGMVWFAALWASTGLLTSGGLSNFTMTLLLLPAGFLGWLLFDRTWQGLTTALLTAAVGVGVESALTRTGTYYYTRPDFLGVPMWLPAVYVTACGAVGNLGRYMKYSWDLPPEVHIEAPARQVEAA